MLKEHTITICRCCGNAAEKRAFSKTNRLAGLQAPGHLQEKIPSLFQTAFHQYLTHCLPRQVRGIVFLAQMSQNKPPRTAEGQTADALSAVGIG